jgi:hypothetical protein
MALAYQAGPTAVLRSKTPWSQCLTLSGQRWAAPQLSASPSGLLTTALSVWQNDDGNGCCTAGNPWILEGTVAVSSPSFLGVDAGTFYAAPSNDSCNINTVPRITRATVAFALYVPQRNAWQIFFSDDHESPTIRVFYTARVQPGGQLSGVKRLFDLPALTAAPADFNAHIAATVTPAGIFVAWGQKGILGSLPYAYSHVRYALFDLDLNAPLWGPFAIGGTYSTRRYFYGMTAVGQEAMLLTSSEASGGFLFATQSVSLVDGGPLGALQQLSTTLKTQGNTTDLLSTDPGLSPAMATVNGGAAIAHVLLPQPSVTTQSSLNFLWFPAGADAGTPARVSLSLPGIPSAVSLLPLSQKQVAAVWIAGQLDGGPGPLTRAIFECGP